MSLIGAADIGTGFSEGGVFLDNQIKLLKLDGGVEIIPSVVYIKHVEGQQDPVVRVGQQALGRATDEPHNVIFGIKHLIGRRTGDENVQQWAREVPYKVVDNDGMAAVEVEGRMYTPEFITAQIIKMIKAAATRANKGEAVDRFIIGCPAYFNESQRQATMRAAEMAGAKVERLVNEPSAAGYDYKFKNPDSSTIIFIVDMGAGTFDLAVLEPNVEMKQLKVRAKAGWNELGGDHFTAAIAGLLRSRLPMVGELSPASTATLMKVADEIKRTICEEDPERKITLNVCREEYEMMVRLDNVKEACAELFRKMKATFDLIKDGEPEVWAKLKSITVMGGGTLIPIVREWLRANINLPLDDESLDARTAVVRGLTIIAGKLSPPKYNSLYSTLLSKIPKLVDALPMNLSVAVGKEKRLYTVIPRHAEIPVPPTPLKLTFPTSRAQYLTVELYEGITGKAVAGAENEEVDKLRLKVRFTRPPASEYPILPGEKRALQDIDPDAVTLYTSVTSSGLLEVNAKMDQSGEVCAKEIIEDGHPLNTAEYDADKLDNDVVFVNEWQGPVAPKKVKQEEGTGGNAPSGNGGYDSIGGPALTAQAGFPTGGGFGNGGIGNGGGFGRGAFGNGGSVGFGGGGASGSRGGGFGNGGGNRGNLFAFTGTNYEFVGTCFNCRQKGHMAQDCPKNKPQNDQN